MKRRALLLLAVCVWWTLEGLVTTGQLLSMQGADGQILGLRPALLRGLASASLWVPCTLALFWCVARYPIERDHLWRSLLVLMAATLLVILVRALAVVAFNDGIGWYRELPPFRDVLLTSVLNNLLMSWLIIGIGHALLYARRAYERQRQAEQLQVRLAEARLESLRAQLDPHFLFNALNSIAEMVHRDAMAADRMLVGLGELLRSSLDHRQTRLVPLREELRLLRHYLEIEKARLGERLQLCWDIDVGLDEALVPPLLLQPLAENAIHHAIAGKIAPGSLQVRAWHDGAWLLLAVRDDGDGGERTTPSRDGTGLGNLRARLVVLYGDEQSLQLQALDDEGTEALLRVPLQMAAPATRLAA
ncbi:histidine kinase [Luteimonas cucumeris]|uniref:Histidine kinase n=1 Tax=Luteimonas cucumeris TaxID=985012 RepID=A0A562LBG8_9GAMM|nr:histidine kinase [Luteimonas cucumeris]TWI04981.1 histidine kinase [Luteimonas cucumeris]